jgi:DNA-binding response OmpR family regulator
MHTRKRILVVEDEAPFRESCVANLKRANYHADGAESLSAAKASLELRNYHVALVDIMLAGKDESNRDGVEVVEHIRKLGEGTATIVVSAQDKSRELVRDLLKEYGAFDYIDKRTIGATGTKALLEVVERALQNSANQNLSSWERIVRELGSGQSEEAFAGNFLHHLEFKGGFENLSHSLQRACIHLMPLIKKKGDDRGMRYNADEREFKGQYWSKGQGRAVELLMFGRQHRAPLTAGVESSILYQAEKGGLSTLIVELSEMDRDDFVESAN